MRRVRHLPQRDPEGHAWKTWKSRCVIFQCMILKKSKLDLKSPYWTKYWHFKSLAGSEKDQAYPLNSTFEFLYVCGSPVGFWKWWLLDCSMVSCPKSTFRTPLCSPVGFWKWWLPDCSMVSCPRSSSSLPPSQSTNTNEFPTLLCLLSVLVLCTRALRSTGHSPC